ncbi:MAG TPA: type II CAAX endopeptidase family protein [Candidatus Methylomirabilis sp.]|nr:type II CAAX endopeptidase family protein [Candidatus Methylomirabilis sp.]
MRFWPVRERKAPIESVSLPARPPDGDGASSLDRPWSVAELWIGSAVVLPFWVVVYLVGSVPLQALVGPTWDYASPILSNAVYVAIAAVTASMFLWSRKAGLKVLFGPALSLRHILLILAGLAAMLAVDLVWVALMPPVSPAMPTPGPAIPLPEPWLDVFSTVVAAPVVEEVLFRAVLFTGFSTFYGPFLGATFSSAIFAAYHINPPMFPSHFVFAMIAAYLYRRTRSLSCAILFHSSWNALLLILASVLV